MSAVLAIGLAQITIGYLIIQFGALVLDDAAADRESSDQRDADTVRWLHGLHDPVTVTPTGDGGLDALLGELLGAELIRIEPRP